MSARPVPVRRSVRARPHLRWVPSPRFIDVQLKPKDPKLRASIEEALREVPRVQAISFPDLIVLTDPKATPGETMDILGHETLHNELDRLGETPSSYALDANANNVNIDRTGLGIGMGYDLAGRYRERFRRRMVK